MEIRCFFKYITYVLLFTIFATLIPVNISVANGGTATITGNIVNVRAGPATSHSIVDQVPKGSKVSILEEGVGWTKVKLSNGKTGWVSKDLLKVDSPVSNTGVSSNIGVSVNGKKVSFDVHPFVNSQNRTMVPIRFIGEELGSDVDWMPAEQKVVIKRQGQEIQLWIGKTQAIVGGNSVTMDTQAELSNGRTMVPLRFISESFGAEVEWQASNKMVVITTAVSQPQGDVVVVTTDTANVRSAPGTENSQVGQADSGNEFKILNSSYDKDGEIWHQITLDNGEKGWIAGWLVTIRNGFSEQKNPGGTDVGNQQQMAIVTGNVVNIRKGPGTSFEINHKVNLGDILEILNKSGNWYYVKTSNGGVGWITGDYVSLQSIRDDRYTQVSRGTGTVVASINGSQNLSYPALSGMECEELNEAFFLTLQGNYGLRYSTMYLENPYRVVIDFQGVKVDLPIDELEKINLNNPFIKQIRAGQFSDDVARIVLDLESAVGFSELSKQGDKEITFLFQKGSLAGKLIVIDPGHGTVNSSGISDPGAIGPSGLYERDVVMDISNKVASILTEKGAKVILTRTGQNTSLTLDGRVQLANSANADLFVSIHADALNQTANGTTTYYYAPANDPVLGPQRTQRARLAQLVQQSVVAHGGRHDRGIKQSAFRVIKDTNMPSILVETAFISNPAEEKLLADPAFRAKIAAGIAEGIERYYN